MDGRSNRNYDTHGHMDRRMDGNMPVSSHRHIDSEMDNQLYKIKYMLTNK